MHAFLLLFFATLKITKKKNLLEIMQIPPPLHQLSRQPQAQPLPSVAPGPVFAPVSTSSSRTGQSALPPDGRPLVGYILSSPGLTLTPFHRFAESQQEPFEINLL